MVPGGQHSSCPFAEIVASVRGRSIAVREAVLGDVRTLVELMAEFYAESGYVLDRARKRSLHGAAMTDRKLMVLALAAPTHE